MTVGLDMSNLMLDAINRSVDTTGGATVCPAIPIEAIQFRYGSSQYDVRRPGSPARLAQAGLGDPHQETDSLPRNDTLALSHATHPAGEPHRYSCLTLETSSANHLPNTSQGRAFLPLQSIESLRADYQKPSVMNGFDLEPN